MNSTKYCSSVTLFIEPLWRLINERLSLMPDVARCKWNAKSAIEDLPREQRLIEKLKIEARALGVPEEWAERFFRAQIEAAKLIQREHFTRWEQCGLGPFADVPNLTTAIRPRLDVLTSKILHELAAVWPALADPAESCRIALAIRNMPTDATNGQAVALATIPLIDGSASIGAA